MVNLSSSLIGLSILTGNGSAAASLSSMMASIETNAVRKAKANFTTPATTAPWQEPAPTTSTYRQVEAIKAMRSIIDTMADPAVADLPDVETSFTAYKAIDRLRMLAEEAAKSGTTASEREDLDRAFAKGLDDLSAYLADAPSDQLYLYFDRPRRTAESMDIPAENASGKVTGRGVVAARNPLPDALTGKELVRVELADGGNTGSVTVDFSTLTQPPTKQAMADALNAAIGTLADPWQSRFAVVDGKLTLQTQGSETVALKSPVPGMTGTETLRINLDKNNGAVSSTITVDLSALDIERPPTLDEVAAALNDKIGEEKVPGLTDANGNPISRWQSKFVVEKIGDQWGMSFQAAGIEQVSIDQVGAADSLMVLAGQDVTDMAQVGRVLRFDNVAGTPEAHPLTRVNGVESDGSTAVDTIAGGIATDAQGFSYVVGTTAGDVGYSRSDGNDDLFLTKLDSEGRVVWQRTLGTIAEARGAAVSIAANGDVVVAGTVTGLDGSDSGDSDMLVARFDANGDEIFSRAIGGTANESASAVKIAADGSIYVAGKTSGNGGDAYVARLSATGAVIDQTVLPDSGGSAMDSVAAIETDADGNLLVLTRENGEAKLRRLSTASGDGLAQIGAALDLGHVNANAIAVSNSGEIAVAGTAAEAVAGSDPAAMLGESDGFVSRIAADLTITSTTYVGSDKSDQIDSIAFMGGALYVGGRTSGSVDGKPLKGTVDGFIARIEADGSVGAASQFGTGSARTGPVRIAAATGGSGIIGKLGLSRGLQNAPDSTQLTARTSLRPDDSFKIAIAGATPREISIDEGETLDSLADKIRTVLGSKGTVSVSKVGGVSTLKINAKEGYPLELIAGPDGEDVLAKLGIDPGRIIVPKDPGPNDPKVMPGGSFGLQLAGDLSLLTRKDAQAALAAVKSALSMTQTAYRSLYWDSSKEALVNGNVTAQPSAYQQAQLANYQAALARLTAGTDTSSLLF